MALWYETGAGPARTTLARARLGLDVYLCCPGPSLANVDAAALIGPGRLIAALNTAYPRVRPDLWIGLDRPECYAATIWDEPFPKFVRANQVGWRSGCPNVYLPDLEERPAVEMFTRRGAEAKFVCGEKINGLTFALHLLIWMGAQRIHLVGCDFGGASDYHDGRQLTDAQREYNRRLYGQQIEMLRTVAPIAGNLGIEILSSTADSPVNGFLKYLSLAEGLARYGTPSSLAPMLHVLDSEQAFRA